MLHTVYRAHWRAPGFLYLPCEPLTFICLTWDVKLFVLKKTIDFSPHWLHLMNHSGRWIVAFLSCSFRTFPRPTFFILQQHIISGAGRTWKVVALHFMAVTRQWPRVKWTWPSDSTQSANWSHPSLSRSHCFHCSLVIPMLPFLTGHWRINEQVAKRQRDYGDDFSLQNNNNNNENNTIKLSTAAHAFMYAHSKRTFLVPKGNNYTFFAYTGFHFHTLHLCLRALFSWCSVTP